MIMPESIRAVLDSVNDDVDQAAEHIYTGPSATALFVIGVGLKFLMARHRKERRRELRADIKPEFKPGRTTGSAILTDRAKRRMLGLTNELYGVNGYKIGRLSLENFTKESLLDQARKERKSSEGHINAARLYEAFAEPMKPGQKVGEYWTAQAAAELKAKILGQKSEAA